MSFLARNEYLLSEIDYCHDQLCARLTGDVWSANYREIWDNICLQLRWYDHFIDDRAGDRLVRRLFSRTRYGRLWPIDSPVLSGTIALARTTPIACRTIFGFDLMTTGQGPWETIAFGVYEPGETLLLLRLLPYLDYMLEIGAGNGYYSFLAAQHGAGVTAIEPSPAAYKLLQAGIALNGYGSMAAPPCTLGDSAAGGTVYLEDGPATAPLSLSNYRAASTLVKLTADGFERLLAGAADWLAGYDAPTFVLAATADGRQAGLDPAVMQLLAGCDYHLFAVNRQPDQGMVLLTPAETGGKETAGTLVALPPMAHDLAEQLAKAIDMRIFTVTTKLENLFYFVKTTFEEL